jgi:hypothetical protein
VINPTQAIVFRLPLQFGRVGFAPLVYRGSTARTNDFYAPTM